VWQHAACTYDGATVRLYVNGALLASMANTQTVSAGQKAGLSLGFQNPGGQFVGPFNGFLDDVRILSVARSAELICADAGRSGC
jgi:hypothetical protein